MGGALFLTAQWNDVNKSPVAGKGVELSFERIEFYVPVSPNYAGDCALERQPFRGHPGPMRNCALFVVGLRAENSISRCYKRSEAWGKSNWS